MEKASVGRLISKSERATDSLSHLHVQIVGVASAKNKFYSNKRPIPDDLGAEIVSAPVVGVRRAAARARKNNFGQLPSR